MNHVFIEKIEKKTFGFEAFCHVFFLYIFMTYNLRRKIKFRRSLTYVVSQEGKASLVIFDTSFRSSVKNTKYEVGAME